MSDWNYQLLNDMSPCDVKNNTSLAKNVYLLVNDMEIVLVRKYSVVNIGYVYNTSCFEISVLFVWKLIKISEPLANDIMYETLNLDRVKNLGPTVNEICNNTLDLDLNSMVEYPSIIAVIPRDGKKTKRQLVQTLIPILNKENRNDFLENSLVISPTERMDAFYAKKFPGIKVIYTIDDNMIGEYLAKQKGCIIFDDCFRSKKFKFDEKKNLYDAMMDGRHYRVPIIVFKQTPIRLPIEIHLNFDYNFIYKKARPADFKQLWDNYFSFFMSFNIFKTAFTKLMTSNDFLMINNRKYANDIREKMFKCTLPKD